MEERARIGVMVSFLLLFLSSVLFAGYIDPPVFENNTRYNQVGRLILWDTSSGLSKQEYSTCKDTSDELYLLFPDDLFKDSKMSLELYQLEEEIIRKSLENRGKDLSIFDVFEIEIYYLPEPATIALIILGSIMFFPMKLRRKGSTAKMVEG